MPSLSSKVDFTSSSFTEREIRYEIPSLLTNSSAKVLHLPVDRLDEASTKCVVMILERDDVGPQIEELHLSHSRSGENSGRGRRKYEDTPFTQIIASLIKSTRVKKLVISETALNYASEISAVATMLYDVKSLRSLVLRQCGLDHKAVTKLSCALASNTSLESLDISNNPIGNRGASGLGVGLEINTSLKKLKLSGTQFGIEGAVAIATALKSNSTLEVLDLSRVPIGDTGASKIAMAMKSNNTLRQLGLRETSLSDVGALCILLSIYDCKSLNAILKCNHSLRYLNLSNNEVSRKSIRDIDTALTMNLLQGQGMSHAQTEKGVIRQKISFFLNAESNTSCFGENMTLQCMPHLLSAIGNNENMTSLYNVVKRVNMPTMFELRHPPSGSADSLFSNETNRKPDRNGSHDKNNCIPAFIEL